MANSTQHFEISKLKEYLYVIKENISLVHPVYTNDPLNMYLLLGEHSALLLDTGCGLSPLKPVVEDLITDRDLIVLNSHTHWDHILGNKEFDEVFVHEKEAYRVSRPYDVSYFQDSPNKKVIQIYANQNYLIPPAPVIKTFKDQDVFDLGGLKMKIVHCPGHSPGSVCLLTSKNELFTSDVAYYGDQFLPKKENFSIVLKSLSNLIDICKKYKKIELYPSHRRYPCDITLLIDLYNGIENIENLWYTKKAFDFFNAWQVDDETFRYYVSRT